MPFCCFYCQLSTYFTPFFSVSIADFEQLNVNCGQLCCTQLFWSLFQTFFDKKIVFLHFRNQKFTKSNLSQCIQNSVKYLRQSLLKKQLTTENYELFLRKSSTQTFDRVLNTHLPEEFSGDCTKILGIFFPKLQCPYNNLIIVQNQIVFRWFIYKYVSNEPLI